MDSLTLVSSDFHSNITAYDTNAYTIDSLNWNTTFHWSGLEANEYTFKFQTLFNRSQTLSFSLHSDTSFELKNDIIFNPIPYIQLSKMMLADTIECAYTIDGCYIGEVERICLVKAKDGGYMLEYTPDHTNNKKIKIIDNSIIQSLFELQIKSKKALDDLKKRKHLMINSTTRCFYILVNNELFKFNDQGLEDWNLYNQFKAKYLE